MHPHITVVTSCSRAGWAKYGYKCLLSMGQHWPKDPDVTYMLISEDTMPVSELEHVRKHHKFEIWPLQDSKRAVDFYARHANNQACQGYGSKMRGSYDFRKDAWRFSKKVFAIAMAANMHPYGRLIWLDADTITLRPVPIELLRRLPPDTHHIAYLDRSKNRYHSECGFVGYNLNCFETYDFIIKLAALYADDEVFALKEWHDSWVFDWLRSRMPTVKGWPIPHTNIVHPFNFSELGQYMDHLKGNRKNLGVSTEHPRFKRKKG